MAYITDPQPTRLSPAKEFLNDIRASWRKPGSKDGWLASHYFDLTRSHSQSTFVDDKTWIDLEFPKLFQILNTTMTPIGGQALFRRLRSYVGDPMELAKLYRAYEYLRTDSPLRERCQIALARLQADSNALLAGHVFGPTLEKPRHSWLIVLLSLLSVATLGAALASLIPLWVWIAVIAMNSVLALVLLPGLSREVDILNSCNQLIRAADELARCAPAGASVAHLDALVADAPNRKQVRPAFQWFWLTRINLVTETLAYWLNLLLLTDFLAYMHNVHRFTLYRPIIASTFELVGALDADIAIASFMERCPDHCQPTVTSSPLIDLAEVWHPMLTAPVKASVCLNGRSALITGSNMAGKTTFIKTVGVNLIMGRTLGVCTATRAVVPQTSVMASIRGEHSVESGKSHYFAEIEAIKVFFNKATTGECAVFLIDELFNGTNTIERLAAARAVLETLSNRSQVFVTTHDVELQASLADRFDLFHFIENPDVDGYFDYQLRTGETVERNAIRLLGRMGFPDEVVTKALAYSQHSRNA